MTTLATTATATANANAIDALIARRAVKPRTHALRAPEPICLPAPTQAPAQSSEALLALMPDGVFIARDGCFVFANEAFARMLGHTCAEMAGMPFEQVVAPDYLSLWRHRFARRIGGGEQPQQRYRLRMLRKDGDELWVELHAD